MTCQRPVNRDVLSLTPHSLTNEGDWSRVGTEEQYHFRGMLWVRVGSTKGSRESRKHGVKFEDACCVFMNPYRNVFPDDRDYDEDRWIAIGRVNSTTLVVVFTERDGRERIISARKAKRAEEQMYYASPNE